jgi:putative zinc finger protein
VTTLDPFAHFDGAYVLGALSDAERADFEEHLRTCPACTERVRELAPLPALLAGVPPEAYGGGVDDMPETLLPALLGRVQAERRRRHWLALGLSGLAAACLVALAVIAWPGTNGTTSGDARPQAMSAVLSTPVHATAALIDVAWGTRIQLKCRYDSRYLPGGEYQLVVVDKQSKKHLAGSWKLAPGEVTTFTGGTALTRDQISKVEITLPDEQPVLQLTL